MILARAPLRISFVGGVTDQPYFCQRYPGRVISTTIDKYVYIAINYTPFINKVSARYAISETVQHPSELQHTRIKAALLDLGIHKNIEIGSFASLPSKTGLGSSSSFSVALMKGLHAFLGKKISRQEAAEQACRLEIDLLKEPIGKQDQYAASFGGLNFIQFNPDGSTKVRPILIDFKKRLLLQSHILLFFTGITRDASSVLADQQSHIDEYFETYKDMSDSVYDFEKFLLAGNIKNIGNILHQQWLQKKTLGKHISNPLIDSLYEQGMRAGAFGGKVLGAGGGGCILFIAPPDKHEFIRQSLENPVQQNNLENFQEIPVKFVECGTDVLFNYLHII